MHVHVHVIYISVVMILNFVASSKIEDIQDLNDLCLQGRINSFYLTSGRGLTDKAVAMIANEKNFSCTLTYSVKPKQNLMLVLEFPDLKPNEAVCINDQETSITVSNTKDEKTCQCNVFSPIYSRISEEKISVVFKNEGEMKTVKITVTSMRDPQNKKCFTSNETECLAGEKIFCMTQKVACDGHNNCGVPDSYDENKEKCRENKMTVVMIFFSILMGVVSVLLLVSFGLTFLPKRKEIFVYKFDQSMPLFDNEGGIVNVEIEIEALFPQIKKKPQNH